MIDDGQLRVHAAPRWRRAGALAHNPGMAETLAAVDPGILTQCSN